MLPRHVLSVEQFTREDLGPLFLSAEEMRQVAEHGASSRLAGRILATLFYEPSTRTRMSFESAMFRLGGQVITAEDAAESSSAAKGETIEDTIRIVESYADAIVIRHPHAGASDRAASVASVPIVNAGDGAHEHPTQALLDLFTIHQELGRIDELTVALVGDLRYGRAPRSLAMLLTRTQGSRVILTAPDGIGMSADVLASLRDGGVATEVEPDLMRATHAADVVYLTRVQKERFPSAAEYEAARGSYRFGQQHLDALREDAIIMHPLPRVDEIDASVDADPRAVYFRQARNGVYVRMALLDGLLGASAGRASAST
jgi:aspartate carbamoyltransferase catalytic subunit